MSHLRKSLHLHYLLLFSYQDLKETLNVASQKELTSSELTLQNTLQEHQRIRTNATVSKDSEIVKIPK